MRYQAHFYGRTTGAIGIFYGITTTVEAPDQDAARLALYDRFEHIQGLHLIKLPPAQPAQEEASRTCRRCGEPLTPAASDAGGEFCNWCWSAAYPEVPRGQL